MSEKNPNDSLSLEWGRFKASAIGRWAVVILAIIATLFIAAHVLGLWHVSSVIGSLIAIS